MSISSFFNTKSPGIWQNIQNTVQGAGWNVYTCAISGLASTGTYMWSYHSLRSYIPTEDLKIKDFAIHAFSFFTSTFIGGYVGNKVGYAVMPIIGKEEDYWVLGYITAAVTAWYIGDSIMKDAKKS